MNEDTTKIGGSSQRTAFWTASLLLGGLLIAGPAPAAADCHSGDPVDTARCVVADVDAKKEHDADWATGTTFTILEAQTFCDNLGWVPWENWTEEHDATCEVSILAYRSFHGSSGGAVSDTHPAAPSTRGVLGVLYHDGVATSACVPPSPDGPTWCKHTVFLVGADPVCTTIGAETVRNTGYIERVERSGPFTYC